MKIRKKNWKKVKELGAQNKYAILVYDICHSSDYKFSTYIDLRTMAVQNQDETLF